MLYCTRRSGTKVANNVKVRKNEINLKEKYGNITNQNTVIQ